MWLCAFASRADRPGERRTRTRAVAADPLAGSAATHLGDWMESGRATVSDCAAHVLDRAFHQALGLSFQFKPRILMGLAPGQRRDPLHEIKDAFGLAVFLAQARFR